MLAQERTQNELVGANDGEKNLFHILIFQAINKKHLLS